MNIFEILEKVMYIIIQGLLFALLMMAGLASLLFFANFNYIESVLCIILAAATSVFYAWLAQKGELPRW